MDDEQSLLTEPQPDAAAEAFAQLSARVAGMEERLEGRMAMVTRAVEHLAIERQSIEIPDYTPTLGQMNGHLAALVGETRTIRESPAQRLTPKSLAHEIAEAAKIAREADRATITQSLNLHREADADLRRAIGNVRTKEQQRWYMAYCGGGVLLAISLLWLIYPGWAASIGPRSWLWPEALARRTLGEASLWDAGVRLMRVGNPEGWQAIVEAAEMRRANRDTVNACEQAAAKAKKSVDCTIMVGEPQG